MLLDIIDWWLARMVEIGVLLRLLPIYRERLLISLEASSTLGEVTEIRIERQRGRRRCQLGVFPLTQKIKKLKVFRRSYDKIVLSFNSDVLIRHVTMPLIAESGLENFLKHEMDRLTPFLAEDVMWHWRLIERNRTRGLLDGELIILPRISVKSILDKLAEVGLRPLAIEVQSMSGRKYEVPLIRPDPTQLRRKRLHSLISIFCCILIIVVGAVTPALLRWRQLEALNANIEMLRPKMDTVINLKKRIETMEGVGATMIASRSHAADALRALFIVTEDLPDEIYLTQYAYNQGRLNIEGRSSVAATRILTSFTADRRLTEASFTAPVTHDDDGKELFAVQARLSR